MRRPRNNRGVTLIEAVTAILVLGIAIPPLVYLFQQVSLRHVDTTYQQVATAYADGLMEEIVSKAYEDPDVATGSFGTEESSRAAYDDIDDFDGMSNSSPKRIDGTVLSDYGGFTRSVKVDNVTGADPDPATPATDGSTGFKRIKVTVTWTGGKGGEVTLTTLRTLLGSGSSGSGSGSPGSLNEAASIATVFGHGLKHWHMDLINTGGTGLEVASFSLSADTGTPAATKFELFPGGVKKKVWENVGGVSLPTGTQTLNLGTSADRTIGANTTVLSKIHFVSNNASGPITYTWVINFTDGSSSTLVFTINW